MLGIVLNLYESGRRECNKVMNGFMDRIDYIQSINSIFTGLPEGVYDAGGVFMLSAKNDNNYNLSIDKSYFLRGIHGNANGSCAVRTMSKREKESMKEDIIRIHYLYQRLSNHKLLLGFSKTFQQSHVISGNLYAIEKNGYGCGPQDIKKNALHKLQKRYLTSFIALLHQRYKDRSVLNYDLAVLRRAIQCKDGSEYNPDSLQRNTSEFQSMYELINEIENYKFSSIYGDCRKLGGPVNIKMKPYSQYI